MRFYCFYFNTEVKEVVSIIIFQLLLFLKTIALALFHKAYKDKNTIFVNMKKLVLLVLLPLGFLYAKIQWCLLLIGQLVLVQILQMRRASF